MVIRTRDRVLSGPVGRALYSPVGLVLAAATTAAGVVVGLPLVAVGAAGVAVWAARVAVAVPRGWRADGADPAALDEPWRGLVEQARGSRRRFLGAVDARRKGPLRDQLASLDEHFVSAVQESWQVGRDGQQLSESLASVDKNVIYAALTRMNWDADGPPAPGTVEDAARIALEAQLESVQQIERAIEGTQSEMRLLNARLEQAVNRSIELSLRDDRGHEEGGRAVDSVLAELATLTAALREIEAVDALGSGRVTTSPALDAHLAPTPDPAPPPARPVPRTG